MKKTLLTIALVAATVAAFAQGKVGMGNDSLHLFVLGTNTLTADTALGGQPIPASPLPSGRTLIALLFTGNGTAGNNLTLASSWALDAANWLSPGRMAQKGISVAGLTGGVSDTLAVVIADIAPANGTALPGLTTAEWGALGAFYFGTSGLFTFTPGTSLTYPSIVTGTSTWAPGNLVINAVPEPATFALAGLGAAALLIFRRRK